MKITNINSLVIANQIQQTSQAISQSLERLSTGKRINTANDDLAGFSTAVKQNAQIRGLQQSNLNINQVYGLLQTADSAMSVQMDILQKMRDLSVQGADGNITSNDRTNLNTQVQALLTQFMQITSNTEFNGTKLLDGSFGNKNIPLSWASGNGNNLNVQLDSLQASKVFEKTVGTAKFSSDTSVSTGGAPRDFALVDFNNDGNVDMASIDNTDDTVSVALGNGDGTFQGRTTVSIEANPVILRAGDVNNDGIQDLVVSNNDASTDSLGVLLGNGDGTFQAEQTYQITNAASTDFVLTDLNNDGYLDLVSGTDANSISVLLNNGDGTFQNEVTTAALTNSSHLQTADFNGDGNQDIVLTNSTSGLTQVMLGDGSGNFNAMSTINTALVLLNINTAVGDFNEDGKVDLLVSEGNAGTVDFFAGNGDGTFASKTAYSAAGHELQISVGDFNSDGHLDFVGRSGTVNYLNLGDGNGGFTQGGTYSATTSNGLQVADLNNDGVDDFASVSSSGNAVSLFVNYTSTDSAVKDVNVSSVDSAQKMIGIIDTAMGNLSGERAQIGANLSVLNQASSYNTDLQASYSDALSNVQDVDLAAETSKLVSQQILQQSQMASLTQANLDMQVVLGLLKF